MATANTKGKGKSLDRLFNDLTTRANALDSVTDNGNTNNKFDSSSGSDHDYYLDIGTEPPRFGQYRLARIRLKQNVYDHDTIIQDELDYYLKSKLREPQEQRYQREKKAWYFHDLTYLVQTRDDQSLVSKFF